MILTVLFISMQSQAWDFNPKKSVRVQATDAFDFEQISGEVTSRTSEKVKSEISQASKAIGDASRIIQKRMKVSQKKADRTATLVVFASKKYNIDPRKMLAIIKVESDFNQRAHNSYSCQYKRETDKTKCGDHSIAQINYHIWKKDFITQGRKPLDYNRLKTDDSYAIFRMAEILSILKNQYGSREDWYAMYHSKNPKHKNPYRKKVDAEFNKIREINPTYLFQQVSLL